MLKVIFKNLAFDTRYILCLVIRCAVDPLNDYFLLKSPREKNFSMRQYKRIKK